MFAWLAVSCVRCKYRFPDSLDPSRVLHLCSFKNDAKLCHVQGAGMSGCLIQQECISALDMRAKVPDHEHTGLSSN